MITMPVSQFIVAILLAIQMTCLLALIISGNTYWAIGSAGLFVPIVFFSFFSISKIRRDNE